MTYARLDLDEDHKRSAIIYFSGPDEILGLIKNPLWSGKIPILSKPVDRIKGSFNGKSKIEPVKYLQWNLCDFWNMGQDSAQYSMLPIYAVDPLKTPQWASGLVIGPRGYLAGRAGGCEANAREYPVERRLPDLRQHCQAHLAVDGRQRDDDGKDARRTEE